MHNQESRILQYAMQIGFLTWLREIEIIGAVAASEVSRFARKRRDWQQLIEMFRVLDTLLVNQEDGLRSASRSRSRYGCPADAERRRQ